MPVLNEVEGMKIILPSISRSLYHQILIVDGRSSDGSAEYARSQGYEVYVQKSPGIRNAYREAWPLIQGDTVVTFSPDGNCQVSVIPQLIEKMKEGNDMVIASRYWGGARSDDDDWLTAFGNWMFTRLINFFHGSRYTDAMGIFRAYRTSLFKELSLDEDPAYRFEKWFGTVVGIEPLLSIRAAKKKVRVTEVLGIEKSRIAGLRKLQPFRWGMVYLMQVFRELYAWR